MGNKKCPTWNWRKKTSPSFPMRDMIETFAPSHIPFFLGHNPGISSSWDLEQTGGLQSDFQIPVARCFTFVCVIQKPMIPCYLNAPWTLAQFFPFKTVAPCTVGPWRWSNHSKVWNETFNMLKNTWISELLCWLLRYHSTQTISELSNPYTNSMTHPAGDVQLQAAMVLPFGRVLSRSRKVHKLRRISTQKSHL